MNSRQPNTPSVRIGHINARSARDLVALQDEIARLSREVSPQGIEATLTLAVGMLHRYGTSIVHVDQGRLKNSLTWDVQANQRRGSAIWGTNVEYGIYENARGGDHAFVDRTARQEGPQVERLFHVRITGGQR